MPLRPLESAIRLLARFSMPAVTYTKIMYDYTQELCRTQATLIKRNIQNSYQHLPHVLTQAGLLIASTIIPHVTKNHEVTYIIYPAIAIATRLTAHANLLPVRPITALIGMIIAPHMPQTSYLTAITIGSYILAYAHLQDCTIFIPSQVAENIVNIINRPIPLVYVLVLIATFCVAISDRLFPTPRPHKTLPLPPFLLLPFHYENTNQ